MKFARNLFFIIIVSLIGLVASMPISAEQIFENKEIERENTRIVEVLPYNKDIDIGNALPEIEDKFKIKRIRIDLSEQKMYLYENGREVASFLVSSGLPGMETPIMKTQIYNKHERAWSSYGLWMPYWMAVQASGRIGIHELPEWPNGYKEGEDHLGRVASHGCIRLGVGAAEYVYNWAEIGTEVDIVE